MRYSSDSRNAQLQIAIARWDNEGGAGPDGPQERSSAPSTPDEKIPIKPKEQLVSLADHEPSFHN
jgi:hypothetical protein